MSNYLSYAEIAKKYNIGRNTAIRLAWDSGAAVKIGQKLVRCDEKIIDEYLERKRENDSDS